MSLCSGFAISNDHVVLVVCIVGLCGRYVMFGFDMRVKLLLIIAIDLLPRMAARAVVDLFALR